MRSTYDVAIFLNSDFQEGFAAKARDIIINQQATAPLFSLISDLIINSNLNIYSNIKKRDLPRVEFRAAYVLEYIYFYDNNLLTPFYDKFFYLFPKVTNGSTKRHFAKILTDILKNNRYRGDIDRIDDIAAACVEWIIDKKVRVAVKVWAVESLILLREDVNWLPEMFNEVLDQLSVNPSSGLKVRLSRWRELQL